MALAVCALALASLAPVTGNAAATTVECSSTVAAGGEAECSVSFTISDWRYISSWGTYGNMIELGATGWITMTWLDGKGKTVAEWRCNGFGLLGLDVATVRHIGGSPNSNCAQTTPTASTYAWRDAAGNLLPQTFRARTLSTHSTDSTFHAQMNLAQGNCTPDFCRPDLIPIPLR